MSKYTTEVRYICEQYAGRDASVGYMSVDEIIEKARTKIFDFNYPIFDETHRKVLETKIIRHFYTREIGFETVSLWKFYLANELNEYMPYYNELYRTAGLILDPFNDVDYTTSRVTKETGNSSSNAKGNSNGTNKSDDWNTFSDTPQGGLQDVRAERYLTNATHNTSDGTNTSASESNTNAEYTDNGIVDERVKGKRNSVSYSRLLKEYRETILNIDLQIINQLNDLFMNIY